MADIGFVHSFDIVEACDNININSPSCLHPVNQSKEQLIKTVLKLSVCNLHRLSVSKGALHILTSINCEGTGASWLPTHLQLPTQ